MKLNCLYLLHFFLEGLSHLLTFINSWLSFLLAWRKNVESKIKFLTRKKIKYNERWNSLEKNSFQLFRIFNFWDYKICPLAIPGREGNLRGMSIHLQLVFFFFFFNFELIIIFHWILFVLHNSVGIIYIFLIALVLEHWRSWY